MGGVGTDAARELPVGGMKGLEGVGRAARGAKQREANSRDNYFSRFVTRANIPPFVVSGLPQILIENKEKQTICGLHVSVIVCNVNYRNFNIKSVHGMIK